MNHLVDPSFQGVNRPFVFYFENDDDGRSHSGYYLPIVEIKDCNVMIDGKNFFDQPINNATKKKNENIRKIAICQGDDYIAGCLLDYPYFKENYKKIAIDLSKQQALDADSRTINRLI